MIELLSPAGNIEKLRTAINYGADACYMGLSEFSLRANAGNFSPEELEEVRRIKRESGKKLYCAMNILFKEDQIEKLYTMKDEIASWPFDAFIISDIGLVDFFQKYLPDRDLHLSTQASCINSSSVKAYRNMGFKRIILGREASLDSIKRIKDKVPEMELECFVHGAMCMAYSGRCILSAYLTGRSANQGDCAHTCRWNYKMYALEEEERKGQYMPIEGGDDYTAILSSKDLCMIDHIDELKAAGLDSLKIEGRMKSVYYVAIVTRAYRKAIDDDSEKDKYKRDLFDVSHRQYTRGFFFSSNAVDDSNDVSRPTEYGYERAYMFLGTVKEVKDDGRYVVEVKNQIRKGEHLEFIGPDVPLLSDDSFSLFDKDGNEVEKIDHGHYLELRTSCKLKEGYILRKESDVKIIN